MPGLRKKYNTDRRHSTNPCSTIAYTMRRCIMNILNVSKLRLGNINHVRRYIIDTDLHIFLTLLINLYVQNVFSVDYNIIIVSENSS